MSALFAGWGLGLGGVLPRPNALDGSRKSQPRSGPLTTRSLSSSVASIGICVTWKTAFLLPLLLGPQNSAS